MRANYGTSLRKFLKQKRVLKLVDFGDLPIFQNATTYPCILLAANSGGRGTTFLACNVDTLDLENLQEHLKRIQFNMNSNDLRDKGWALVDEKVHRLLEKLKTTGVRLEEYLKNKIYRGVLTGLNKAFVIDAATRERLIAEDAGSAELIKPFLAGRDVKRYCKLKHRQYLIFTKRGINIKHYPAIERYLSGFKEELTPKPKENKVNSLKGRKPGTYKWYEIQDTVSYHLEFEKPKIVYPSIGKKPEFTIDLDGNYTNNKCFIIPGNDHYLLGVLNSSVIFFLVSCVLTKLRGDFYLFSYIFLKDISIPRLELENEVDRARRQQIETLVSEMLDLHKRRDEAVTEEEEAAAKSAIAEVDRRIDSLVYELYNLSTEEIQLVEEHVGGNKGT